MGTPISNFDPHPREFFDVWHGNHLKEQDPQIDGWDYPGSWIVFHYNPTQNTFSLQFGSRWKQQDWRNFRHDKDELLIKYI